MKISKYIGITALLAVYGACTNEDYQLYDTTQKDSVFFNYIDEDEESAVSLEYAFNFDIATVHTVEIPVSLMGMPVDYDREIKLEPVADETDMVEGTHYTIEDAVIPANEVESTVKINLLRDLDPLLTERSYTLVLKIVENDVLRAVGQNTFTITYSDIRPDKPSWWMESWWYLPDYTFEAAQIFFDYLYGYAAEQMPEVVNEMTENYGEYLVRATGQSGPFALYRTFLINYVLVPMYEDHSEDLTWTYGAPGL